MLIVHRRVGERLVVGGGIEITIANSSRRGVRLGIVAPRGVPVLRGEVHDAVAAANAIASEGFRPVDAEPLPDPVRKEIP
jgi:carbon storage regulator